MKIVVTLALFCLLLFADKDIYFRGNKVVSDSEVSTVLHLKVPPIYYFWEWLNPYQIEENKEHNIATILKRYYRSKGYFLTDIKVVSTKSTIYVYINESEQVKITKLYLDSYLKKYVKLNIGDYFDPEKFVQSKKDILKHYHETGYCHAVLNAKAYVDKEHLAAELHYSVDDGFICRVKKIDIEGIDEEKKKIILEHIELKENQQFDSNNIDRSYQLMQSYGAFSKVSIDYDRADRDKIDLDIPILLTNNEHPRIVKFGIGISSDVGAKLFASWRHQDLFEDMKVLQFGIDLSKIRQKISSTYIHRSFIPINTSFLNVLDYNQYIAYEKKHFLNFTSNNYLFRPALEKIEYIRNLKLGVILDQTQIKEEANKVGLNTIHEDTENYFVVAPFFALDYDFRDSKIRPTHGYYIQNYIEFGEKYLTSDVRYLKLIERLSLVESYYDFIVAMTMKVGVIREYEGKLPISKFFYAGGAYSNRAHIFEMLPTTDTSSLNGGRSLIDSSLNLVHQIYGNWDGLLFLDATLLNEKELSYNTDMFLGVGAGVSYNTLVGPVNISAGVDPNNVNQYAIHFQVGYTF